jgi:arabinogalactan oligomer/maltooligosaccharide transport system substrate-binding protein
VAAIASQAQSTPVATAGASAPTPIPSPTPLAGSLVLWHSWAGSDGDALAAILADLATAYPDVIIETLFVAPGDLLGAYAEAVQAGGGPDLLLAPNWWLGDLVQSNVIQRLDEPIPVEALDAYWPAAVESLRWDGGLYGLPINTHLVALLVNRAVAGETQPPPTLDDWLNQARTDPSLGMGLYATLFHLYWGLPAFGAQLLDADGRVVLDQNGGAADYLTWLAAVDGTPGSYVDLDYGMLLDRFKKGEFAYLVDGPWEIGDLRATLGDSLAVAPLPAGPGGPARPWLYADGVFLNPNLDPARQPLAIAIAQALTSPTSGLQLATIGGLLPANRQVDLSGDPLLAGFATQAATAEAMPTRPEMTELWGYAGDMLLKAMTGVAPPPAIVAETTALINDANGK